MLYPLSYEGGDLYVLVRGYLSVAGERALGRRAQRVPDRRVSDGSLNCCASRSVPGSSLPVGRVVLSWDGFVCSHVIPMRIGAGGTRRRPRDFLEPRWIGRSRRCPLPLGGPATRATPIALRGVERGAGRCGAGGVDWFHVLPMRIAVGGTRHVPRDFSGAGVLRRACRLAPATLSRPARSTLLLGEVFARWADDLNGATAGANLKLT